MTEFLTESDGYQGDVEAGALIPGKTALLQGRVVDAEGVAMEVFRLQITITRYGTVYTLGDGLFHGG